jgi:hypothetical protein
MTRTRATSSRGIEWLRDVVVCAQVKPLQGILFGRLCSQHDDGQVRFCAQDLADFKPIDLWKHPIEDHQAGVFLAGQH